MVKSYAPDRGDVVVIDFDPQAGHEQAGRRPALILSPGSYNSKTRLALMCPITNQAKGYAYEVKLPQGARTTGVILADQVKSLDWRVRRAKKVETVPVDVVDEVLAKISTLLNPDEEE
jgi:mRNA interferase MazF